MRRKVSMEPQIGIRGRGAGVKSLPRRGFEEGLRAMVVLGRRLAPRERTVLW